MGGRTYLAGNRAHSGAVSARAHNVATGEIFHGAGIGIRPGQGLAILRLHEKASTGRKGPIVLVGVAAGKKHNVTRADGAVLLFPCHDEFFR